MHDSQRKRKPPDVNERAMLGILPDDPSDGTALDVEHAAAYYAEMARSNVVPIRPNSHVRVDDGAWRSLLVTRPTKNGPAVVANVSNVVTLLRHHPDWRGVLAWNSFAERVVTRRAPPWHSVVAPASLATGTFSETDMTRVVDWLTRSEGLAVGARVVEQAIPVVAESDSYHPVRDYLESVEWDRVERLPTWLSTYAGAAQSAYTAAIGTRWMISAVARVYQPGCQVDCMLVLEGRQGVGKSSLFRALVPDKAFFSETGVTIGDKDSYQSLHGIWIYLLDELDSLKRGDITRTKNFLTAIKDHYRPSYGRVARDFDRQTVFAGTTNEIEYLVDRTGNRRFWPVRVVHHIDVAGIARDRDQLWAEALQRFANGENWHTDTAELRRLCEAEQAERVHGDPWEEAISLWLANPRHHLDADIGGASGPPYHLHEQGVTTAEVMAHAIGKPTERITRADEMRVAEALRVLGYQRGPLRSEGGRRLRRYKVVQVVQEGGAAPNTEKKASESLREPPELPKATHTQGENDDLRAFPGEADPGGAGGAGDLTDYLDGEGIGGGE